MHTSQDHPNRNPGLYLHWQGLGFLLAVTMTAGALFASILSLGDRNTARAASQDADAQMAALREEVERLSKLIPGQAHAMIDVAYHFGNLWFAGQQENWPLAKFYVDEVRSHLRWSIAIKPRRTLDTGEEIDLEQILRDMEEKTLQALANTIEDKDADAFGPAYKAARANCYACHEATGYGFLRSQLPTRVPEPMIIFRPEPVAS